MQARPDYAQAQNCRGLGVVLLITAVTTFAAGDPFAENIRKTEPLTPEEEQKTFHVPPGFEVQLVAAEPDLRGKPMNLAFDAQGQLWVTVSREYPYAVATNQTGRDVVQVLGDFDENGRARKVTTFADGLNIPIGLLPYRDGVLAFSIPNIYYFADTNADGRADTKELVLGRFGFERDTHGLTGAFRRGYDGWVYADHGFNNNSTLTARDGSSITMNSGNTYRFQPDGARVEQFTWGQVNPFGLMFDPLGDLWSADCHSQPVYMLLRGAYYPSFGKPHDGLGFGPNICKHLHGSTAIAGIVFYAATNFPAEYRNNTFIGNVMTCRINRDSYTEHGSSRLANEEPDFLRSDDPWFRPVDLQLGPDGALYVADFYNRIIGHYEVPLDHPGRDRERGRIWRIVYRGAHGSPQNIDLTRASVTDLIQQLAHPNLTIRMSAMNQLVDRIGQPAVRAVTGAVRDSQSRAEQKAHGLWVLHRLGGLSPDLLASAATNPDRLVRVHAQRVLSETPNWSAPQRELAIAGLRDRDAYVQRAAADALGMHPNPAQVRPLLEARHRVSGEDAQLLHVVRMALRNQLRAAGAFEQLDLTTLSEADSRALTDVALGIQSSGAGSLVLNHARKFSRSRDGMINYLRHAARFAPDTELDGLAEFVRRRFADDLDFQFELFKSVRDGLAQRGAKLPAPLSSWAAQLTGRLLASAGESGSDWVAIPLEEPTANPWFMQKRTSADGNADATFFCSLPPNGEMLTGMLRSRRFTIPPKLTFFLAGHDGFPDQPPGRKNVIRLRAADSEKTLMTAYPPRNDTAQPVTWDLSMHVGTQGVLEIVDGDTGSAYAWLAAGRFDPAVVPLPGNAPPQQHEPLVNAAELARTVPLPQFVGQFAAMFRDPQQHLEVRMAAAQTLLSLDASNHVPLAAGLLMDTNQSPALRQRLALLLAEQTAPVARSAVLGVLVTAPQRLQTRLALTLAGSATGAEAVLALVEQKKLSPQVILDRAVKERLAATKLPGFGSRYETLTAGVAPVSAELQRLIDERRAGFTRAAVSADRGRAVFDKACAVCHQFGGSGAVVGPQLDGVGHRGLERIIEDVLDPNRNVDPAFNPSLVTLKDDTAITGLLRREEGAVLVFVDSLGKEVTVPKSEVVERRESQLSLMPANFGETLSPEEFYDLMAFLLK